MRRGLSSLALLTYLHIQRWGPSLAFNPVFPQLIARIQCASKLEEPWHRQQPTALRAKKGEDDASSLEWLSKKTVPELKEELRARGLSLSGAKSVLIDRLASSASAAPVKPSSKKPAPKKKKADKTSTTDAALAKKKAVKKDSSSEGAESKKKGAPKTPSAKATAAKKEKLSTSNTPRETEPNLERRDTDEDNKHDQEAFNEEGRQAQEVQRMAAAEAKRKREAEEASKRAAFELERERAAAERAWQKAERLEALQKAAEGEKLTQDEERKAAQVAAKAEREWRERNEVLRKKREEEDRIREEEYKRERDAAQLAAANARQASLIAAAETRQLRIEEEAAKKLEEEKAAALKAEFEKEYEQKVEEEKAKLRERIMFTGITGFNAQKLNGAYVPTGEIYNGKLLYAKESDPSLRLYYQAGNSRWSVLADDNTVLLESFESYVELPTFVRMWNVNCGLTWIVQSKISCVHSHPEFTATATNTAENQPVASADAPSYSRVATASPFLPAEKSRAQQQQNFRAAAAPKKQSVHYGAERRTSVHSKALAPATGIESNWLVQAEPTSVLLRSAPKETRTMGECVLSTTDNGSNILGSYRGELLHGTADGRGEAVWKNQRRMLVGRYTGQFKDGQMHGQGTFQWANGVKYDGEWCEDKAHGIGVQTRADGSIIHSGSWVNDEPAY